MSRDSDEGSIENIESKVEEGRDSDEDSVREANRDLDEDSAKNMEMKEEEIGDPDEQVLQIDIFRWFNDRFEELTGFRLGPN